MNFPAATHIPESLPPLVFSPPISRSKNRSDSKRAPTAPEQNPHRPTVRGASWPFSLRGRVHRARLGRTPCAGTFARARAELARAPGSPRRYTEGLQVARGLECSAVSSECSLTTDQRKGPTLLMLARRAEGQKSRPALSFQNAEQGFFAFQFNCAKKLSEHAAFHSPPL